MRCPLSWLPLTPQMGTHFGGKFLQAVRGLYEFLTDSLYFYFSDEGTNAQRDTATCWITQHVPWRSPIKSAIIGNWFPAALIVTQHCWVLGLVSYYQHSGDLASDPACPWVRPWLWGWHGQLRSPGLGACCVMYFPLGIT